MSGEVAREHPAGSGGGTQDPQPPQPVAGSKACMSFPVDVEDDSDDGADDEMPAGICGYEPAAFVHTVLFGCELKGCALNIPCGPRVPVLLPGLVVCLYLS